MMRYKDKTEEDGKGYSEREKENKEIKSKEGEREKVSVDGHVLTTDSES